jgi:hypothetical protein
MPIEPVKLDNIYSLKIEGDTVIDTTFSTRERLKSSDKQ